MLSNRSHGFRRAVRLALMLVAGGVLVSSAHAANAAGQKKGRAQKGTGTTEWWHEIDTGPFISDTILTAPNGAVAALKGIAIKVGAKREASMVFDTELLAWRAGFDGILTLEGTAWSGVHGGAS